MILLATLATVHFYFLFLIASEDPSIDKTYIKGHPIFRLCCLIYP
jgi:hypothetical protein